MICKRRVQNDPHTNTPPCAQRFHERVQQLRSKGLIAISQFQPQSQVPLGPCCPSISSRQQREASHEKCQGMTKGQQVSFKSSANQIAHERDVYNVKPQFVHSPHLRAIEEKSLSACNATVDLAAPSVRQWILPGFIAGSPEHNTLIRIEPWECGQA